MAKRPIFIPKTSSTSLVEERHVEFAWFPGFSLAQKQRCIGSLHAAAKVSPLLEISSKSPDALGRSLSAFSLAVAFGDGTMPLECAFQGSKVFASGGPFEDLYAASPLDAKRDPRLRESGPLVRFQFENQSFPLEPKTLFYDWLYVSACARQPTILQRLTAFGGFTDIEFNPKKSLNCQARSAAILVSLMQAGTLTEALRSPAAFATVVYRNHDAML